MNTHAALANRRTRIDRRKSGGRRLEELNGAIANGQVEILFQPQYSCADGSLLGAEALSRWNHPQLGLISSEPLFDMAARAGHGGDLTRHIARRALAVASNWADSLRISLNVTAMDLSEENFAATICEALAASGVRPERLTLEITEQSLVGELERSAARLAPLAEMGIHIALDDFGAGFCNFRYLKQLPLHALKLDRSMVDGITHDARDLAVLRGIMAMAKALEISVIAEGIETEDQRYVVAREGCASWQGYLGGRPMEAAQLEALAVSALPVA